MMMGSSAIAASGLRMVIVIVAANIGFDVNFDGDSKSSFTSCNHSCAPPLDR